MPAAPVSVRDALRAARNVLSQAACDTPGLDAELLLADALGVPRARLFTHPELELTEEAAARFDAHVARRRRREPVAYIVGRKAFRRLELHVDRRVLIPRPDTETLVEAALELPPGASVLEACTGSGAVALALKDERPDLELTASDLSASALEVARANAERLALEITWVQAPGIAAVPGGPWDAVLANPPYIADDAELPTEIAAYEPPEALWGGSDGLRVVRDLVAELDAVPWVALEVGVGQADVVRRLLQAAGYGCTEVRRDLAGAQRVVIGRR